MMPAAGHRMRRRDLAAALGAALGAVVLARAAIAAEAAKVVGILAPAPLRPIDSFKARLRERGWIEGQNIRFEPRWAEGDDTRYPPLAAELAVMPVDAMMTWGTPALLAAKRATSTIPIVMGAIGDPVGVGAVANLSRPGGNVTGFSTQNYELEAKRLEFLREFVPSMKRIGLLGNIDNPYVVAALKQVRDLAERGGLQPAVVAIEAREGLEAGLLRLARAQPDGVLVAAAPALFPFRRTIVEFMARHRLPAIYAFREFAEVGGLIAYSTNFDDLFRQAADYVDKILRGASPGELPVQQAATFELVINQKAAGALGLAIPPVLLTRADEVIE
jgi:putative tryptophan/tyrosine transport system substrate-binding protein